MLKLMTNEGARIQSVTNQWKVAGCNHKGNGKIGQSLVAMAEGDGARRPKSPNRSSTAEESDPPMAGLDDQGVQTGARRSGSPVPRFGARQRSPAADGTNLVNGGLVLPISLVEACAL